MKNTQKKFLSAILAASSVAGVVAPAATVFAAETDVETFVSNALRDKTFFSFNKAYGAAMALPEAQQAKYLAQIAPLEAIVKTTEIKTVLTQIDKFYDTQSMSIHDDVLYNLIPKVSAQVDRDYLSYELYKWGKVFIEEKQPEYPKATDAIIAIDKELQADKLEDAQALIPAAKIAIAKVTDSKNNKYLNELLDEVLARLQKEVGNYVVSVSAINATTVEVALKESVSDVKSLDFKIEGLDVKNAVVKQTNSKVVVLTTAAQKGSEEYNVTLGGVKIGSFKGIADVIPTSIKFTTVSNQLKVGTEYKVSADIGVKAKGVAVTFNIDGAGLNKDYVVEAVTDENGIASYSYTQYAAGVDTVSVYPTGAPSVRAITSVYWGVDTILSLNTVSSQTVNNQTAVSYEVVLKHPVTGQPLYNVPVNVTFAENIDGVISNDTNATVTDPLTGVALVPYESSTGERVLTVKTDANGRTGFTITGANASVTPIVYIDAATSSTYYGVTNTLEGTGIYGNGNNRVDSRELQVTGQKLGFQGAQQGYTFSYNIEAPTEAAVNNEKEYKVTVKRADGTVYAGGTINVGILERIDASLVTSSNAFVTTTLTNPKVDTYGNSYSGQLQLDSDGSVKFKIKSTVVNDIATPIVWIDQNTQGANTGNLETQEPQLAAPTVVFRDQIVTGVKFNDVIGNNHRGAFIAGNPTNTVNPIYTVELANQSNNASTNPNAYLNRVTYTVTNTGNNPMNVTLSPSNGFVFDATIQSVVTIAAGNSYTVTGYATNSKTASLTVASSTKGNISVVATATTVDSTDTRNNNKYFSTAAKTAEFVDSNVFNIVNGELTGTVVGFRTADYGTNAGYIVVKEDSTGKYFHYEYPAAAPVAVGNDATFANLTTTNMTTFERALSVNDRIRKTAGNQLRLVNVDNSDKDQASGNSQALVSLTALANVPALNAPVAGVSTTVTENSSLGTPIDPIVTGATVTVNGAVLPVASYVVNEATNTVTLTQAYLNTLATATYNVVVTLADGLSATTTLTINSAAAAAITGPLAIVPVANAPVAGLALPITEVDSANVAVADPALTGATVTVNGAAVNPALYVINDAAGFNTVTLAKAYLDTLAQGTYNVSVRLVNGLTATSTFTVNSLAALTLTPSVVAGTDVTPSRATNDTVVITVDSTDSANVVVLPANQTVATATVSVNGVALNPAAAAFVAADGATDTITLNASYLNTLTPGQTYTVTIRLANGLSSQVVITPQF